ncbi:MAG TPA: sugar phosphate isomerase/epimerase [Bryobacteraceae bacterium]|nr:sugar phosphate isomerase/epimerase [Bryobacteraceae bacterium]
MSYTRRHLGALVFGALPAARLFGATPNSKWGGVQVGINVPYSYGDNKLNAEETLRDTLQLGLNAMELRTQPVEGFLGAPSAPAAPRRGQRESADQIAARAAAEDALRKWRLSRGTADFRRFRKKYEDAGMRIQILKVDWIQNATSDVADYCFRMAKALGADALSCEIPRSKTPWLGAIAASHKMMVGYHGHQNTDDPEAFAGPESWDMALAASPYNGINLDIGHFMAANDISPIPFLEKYHSRITHIHVKDMKRNHGPAVPFGSGDVPVKEVLQLMKARKWKFQATIEFEYKIPEGSTRMAEIAKCVDYCRQTLV